MVSIEFIFEKEIESSDDDYNNDLDNNKNFNNNNKNLTHNPNLNINMINEKEENELKSQTLNNEIILNNNKEINIKEETILYYGKTFKN